MAFIFIFTGEKTMNKNENVRLGAEGVERVMALLQSKIYQCVKVYTNMLSPDLMCVAHDNIEKYGVEVKSLKGVSGGKIGRVTIEKKQWDYMLQWCDQFSAIPYAIFEIKGGRAGHLYRFINGDFITEMMKKNGLSLTAWQILKYGKEDFE